MKLGKDVLLEIVDIVRDGLLNNKDISERLRELDLVERQGAILSDADEIGKLCLSEEYRKKYPRGGDWQ